MKDRTEPNFGERALFLISPERGSRRFLERLQREQQEKSWQEKSRERVTMAATGYGNHGASKTLNSMIGWIVGGGSAEDDVDLHGATLRQRARDLYAGGGLARSGPATMTTNVVGWGIQAKPKIDGEFLGMSDATSGNATQSGSSSYGQTTPCATQNSRRTSTRCSSLPSGACW